MRTKFILSGLVVATSLSLALSGCVQPAASSSPTPTPNPTVEAPDPVFAEQPEPQAPPETQEFGGSTVYNDLVQISVSQPSAFTPGEYASGADQAHNIYVSITISNNSTGILQPSVYTRVSSGGVEASSIFDSGNPAGEVGSSPSTAILPGGTITWLEAFSVADPNSLILQIAPSYEYTDTIFTNQ